MQKGPAVHTRPRKTEEGSIQDATLQLLRIAGYWVKRMHLGPVIHHVGPSHKLVYAPNPLRGFPDLFGFCKTRRGRLFVIELKSRKGRLADHQKDWIQDLYTQGALCIVARDPITALKLLQEGDI